MSLNPKVLIENAKKISGLDDFGDELFLEGFEQLVTSINLEASLNEIGYQAQEHRIIGLLTNLLRTVEALKQHPEILNETIKSPIVIVGLPRTGSTMTHRLLASEIGRAHV